MFVILPPVMHVEKVPPAVQWMREHYQLRNEPRRVEFGIGTFLATGITSPSIVGVSPFVFENLFQNVMFRFSSAIGSSPSAELRTTLATLRFDGCWRYLGNYSTPNGLQLDLCAGSDIGFVWISTNPAVESRRAGQTLPFVTMGPSAELKGIIGDTFAVSLRAVTGYGLVRSDYFDAAGSSHALPPVSVRLELNFSWIVVLPPPAWPLPPGTMIDIGA